MTPAKQKAKELIDKYLKLSFGIIEEYIPIPLEFAKQCALIAVDEYINTIDCLFMPESIAYKYYSKVKQEILNYEM